MFDRAADSRIRTATFDWLSGQVDRFGDVLPRSALAEGFEIDGRRVPLLGPQGIFKPAVLDVPLSITTTPHGPYDDAFGSDGYLRYRYRGTDPAHPDNRGLVFAMEERISLVYFHGIVPGKYVAAWPVFVVAANPAHLTFSIAVDDVLYSGLQVPGRDIGLVREDGEEARRRYITAVVKGRLHQRAFRERVLTAYRHACAFCRFKHEELLDAAHITGDAEPNGEPVVRNGISLCRLHHAAFDRHFLGLTPDFRIEVRRDLLEEEDGPTLLHGIQGLQGTTMRLPRRVGDRPDVERVLARYRRFQEAARAS